jgi:hypothetical protein
LIDVQIDAGNGTRPAPTPPPYPLNDGVAPCSRMYSSATESSSAVVTFGRTAARTRSIVPATTRPARRILPISSGDL